MTGTIRRDAINIASRRQLLTSAAFAPVAALVGAAAFPHADAHLAAGSAVPAVLEAPYAREAEPHPDAELLRLGRDLNSAQVAIDALGRGDICDAEMDAAMAPAYAVVDRMEEIEACTLDGLLVQACAFDWCRSGASLDSDDLKLYMPAGVTTDLRMALAIIHGLLGMSRRLAQRCPT